MQNDVAEIKLRAERRAGEMLAETIQRAGDPKSHDVTLIDLGIGGMQSHRWQLKASVPEDGSCRRFARWEEPCGDSHFVLQAKGELTAATVAAAAAAGAAGVVPAYQGRRAKP